MRTTEHLLVLAKLLRACLKTRPVRGPGLHRMAVWAVSCRPRALTRRLGGVFKQALRPTRPRSQWDRLAGSLALPVFCLMTLVGIAATTVPAADHGTQTNE